MKIERERALDILADFVSDVHQAGFHEGVDSLRVNAQDWQHVETIVKNKIADLYLAGDMRPPIRETLKCFMEILSELGFGRPPELPEVADETNALHL